MSKLSAEEQEENNRVIERMHKKLNFKRNPRFEQETTLESKKENGSLNQSISRENELGNFKAQPSIIMFDEYMAGMAYEQSFKLMNTSTISRRIRILPPSTPFFSISTPRFPGSHGMIAPGMSCQIFVRFVPDSLADYQDSITVSTENGDFSLHIYAKREPPSLTIPLTIDCGCVLVGQKTKLQINCVNYGGTGRFRMLPSEKWPSGINEVFFSSSFLLTF